MMNSVTREVLHRQIGLHREDIVRDARALVAIKSRTDNKEKTIEALRFVIEKAKAMGMRTGYTKGMDAGFAEIGEGNETVGVLVHVDVVDIGDPEGWPHDPFDLAQTDDGFLHGRGMVDDKGPVAMSLYALKSIMELKIPLKRRLRLIVGTCEEGIWTDMANYFAEFGMPDFGFSPDGDFPIFNIEKGYCDIHILFREKGRLGEIEEARAGESPNSIPSKAYFKQKGKEQQVFTGVAVHSSEPQNGDNAILKLAKAAADEGYLFGKFIQTMFPDEHASGLALDDGSDTYDGIYVGRTIASPTVLRKKDDGIFLNVNIRSRCGVDKQRLDDAFARHAAEYDYTYSFYEFTSPMMVDPRLPFMQEMMAVYRSYGYPGEFLVAGGASYAATMKNCVCFGPIFPGELSCAHMEDERLLLESMMKATGIYAEYLVVCGEKEANG
jgi:succinyl-diaminopimelate desuccinylase